MKTTTVRIPDDVQEALNLSAGRNFRSLHGEIIVALKTYCTSYHSNITTEEKSRIFENGPDYKELAKKRKEKIKELEELVAVMGRSTTALEETIKGFDPEYFERRFARDRAEEEAETEAEAV
jgi:hypothetical protein